MANRDVVIAVVGVLVGFVLGALSILYSQGGSLNAQVENYAHYVPVAGDTRDLMKRPVTQQVKGEYPRLSGTEMGEILPAAPEVEEVAPEPITDAGLCQLINAIVGSLRGEVIDSMPTDFNKFVEFNRIVDVFDQAAIDCGIDVSDVEDLLPSAPVRVLPEDCLDPDYCYRFTRTRRTHCIVEQAQGICYQPHQTTRPGWN